jgi:DNA-binding NtrC family response regulator
VVDDEDDILKLIQIGLTRHDHSIVTFPNPTVALRKFSHNHQDYMLVLTDVRMPGMSGL